MVKVIHEKCGTQVGWYLRDAPRNPDYKMSEDFIRMDGTKLAVGSPFGEYCPTCKVTTMNLKRVFKEYTPKTSRITEIEKELLKRASPASTMWNFAGKPKLKQYHWFARLWRKLLRKEPEYIFEGPGLLPKSGRTIKFRRYAKIK